MVKIRCKIRKYRKTITLQYKSKLNKSNNKAWNLFVEKFFPTFGMGLARSINWLMYGFVFWFIKKFFKQDLHQLLEILSNLLYKKQWRGIDVSI